MSTLLGTLRSLNFRSLDRSSSDPDARNNTLKKGNVNTEDNKPEDLLEPPRIRGSTPMVTPTFCMTSPILPEVLTTDTIGMQPLLPEAEIKRSSGQLSLRMITEKNPRTIAEDIGSLFRHMTTRRDPSYSTSRLKRERSDREDFTFDKKLKTDSCKSLMLPQVTPPLRAKENVVRGMKALPQSRREYNRSIGHQSYKQEHRQRNTKYYGGIYRGECTQDTQTPTGSALGSSCHQCKSRRAVNKLYICSNQGSPQKSKDRRHICRKKYCDQCLEKFYNENPPSSVQINLWLCPACRSLCCCAACRRNKAKFLYDPRTMSPATSIACGLVFGDMLDIKTQNPEEAVNKVILRQMNLQKRNLAGTDTLKFKQRPVNGHQRNLHQTQYQKTKNRNGNKSTHKQKKQKFEQKKPVKQARRQTKTAPKNAKSAKSRISKPKKTTQKQIKMQKSKLKNSKPTKQPYSQSPLKDRVKQSAKPRVNRNSKSSPAVKVATAQVASARAAAAAAAVAQHNGHWFLQHQQVQLPKKMKQPSHQSAPNRVESARVANGTKKSSLQPQMINVPHAGFQRSYIIPA
mmetsp:Transcript_42836/g.71339  ORF Transcript_42836/g.71339 Transcript_42836/m.71339 type:complete len:571 (-) Transcript_42836:109-1821(-)